MEIVHVSKSPVLIIPDAIERGKVYRLFEPTDGNYFPTESYYIVGCHEGCTDVGPLAAWWVTNLRTGHMMPLDLAEKNQYRFELTEAYVHMGTVTA